MAQLINSNMGREMKKHYFGIFTTTEEAVEVEIPDVQGCVTFGKDFKEAYEMAVDALASVLANTEPQFVKSPPSTFEEIVKKCVKVKQQIVVAVPTGEAVKYDFKPSDIIRYNRGTYKVLENHGIYGTVQEHPSGEIVEKFYWVFDGFESTLIASKEIEVSECFKCPIRNLDGFFNTKDYCPIDEREVEDKRILYGDKPFPSWCPLKSGPIMVRLKE